MKTSTCMVRKAAIAVAVVAGLAASVVAVAQPGYGPGAMKGADGCGPGAMMGAGYGPNSARNPAEIAKFQQEHLTRLKSRLGITAEQQPAWDAYATMAAQQAQTMQALHQTRHQTMSTATAPERLAMAQQVMGERQKAMASMSESLTKLYDVLTPKQREAFDQSRRPMGRRG